MGSSVHAGMEHIMLHNEDVDGAIAAVINYAAKEGLDDHDIRLAAGLVMGWIRLNLTSFLAEFEILSVEKEEKPIFIAPNLSLSIRADVVVRERLTGRIFVINWKTTNSVKDWSLKWMYDLQTLTEALGVEQGLEGETVTGVIYWGFFKGKKREDGTWTSPTCGGYTRLAKSGARVWSGEYKAGWDRFSAENFPQGGQPGWINFLPVEYLAESFPRSTPVITNSEVAEGLIGEIVRWESDADNVLENGSQEDILRFFEKHPSFWNCDRCPFAKVCLGVTTLEGLVEQGKLIPRVDHHGVVEVE